MHLFNRADDVTIDNEDCLWRRVHPTQIINDPNTGSLILSSAVFKTREMSVHIASLTTSEKALENYPKHSLAEFKAGIARSVSCIIVRDPLPEDNSHALILNGKNPNGKLTDSQAKKIATQASLIVYRPPIE